jgi:hypothetical protein
LLLWSGLLLYRDGGHSHHRSRGDGVRGLRWRLRLRCLRLRLRLRLRIRLRLRLRIRLLRLRLLLWWDRGRRESHHRLPERGSRGGLLHERLSHLRLLRRRLLLHWLLLLLLLHRLLRLRRDDRTRDAEHGSRRKSRRFRRGLLLDREAARAAETSVLGERAAALRTIGHGRWDSPKLAAGRLLYYLITSWLASPAFSP